SCATSTRDGWDKPHRERRSARHLRSQRCKRDHVNQIKRLLRLDKGCGLLRSHARTKVANGSGKTLASHGQVAAGLPAMRPQEVGRAPSAVLLSRTFLPPTPYFRTLPGRNRVWPTSPCEARRQRRAPKLMSWRV